MSFIFNQILKKFAVPQITIYKTTFKILKINYDCNLCEISRFHTQTGEVDQNCTQTFMKIV